MKTYTGGKLKNKINFPFQNMTQKGWQNLALASVLIFYLLQLGFDLVSRNMCGNLAIDYCAFWSAGKIINQSGYVDVYNLDLLAQFQKNIYPQWNNQSIPFSVTPIPYLPVFVMPFQLLSLLSLESSFWIWTLLNLLGFILYIRFFTREMTGISLPVRLVLLVMLSLPVFLNLFKGQVNIFLGICAGEFMRATLSKRPFQAGLWLGGWLLKPQLLILILPVLLIQRSIKALTGFIVSAMAAIIISFGLINIKGFIILVNLYLGYAKGMPTNGPEIMMNWRMLGLHITSFTSPTIGWTIAIIGSILTVCVALFISRKPFTSDPTKSAIVLLGIFAATGAVAWHAHLSMSIILILPMIYLYIQKLFPEKLLILWVFMPTMIMFLIYILAALIQAKILPIRMAEMLNLLSGLIGLILNLIILAWAVIEYPKNLPCGSGKQPLLNSRNVTE